MNAGPNTVVVVGAGPAGIASALALKDAGLRPLVIERGDAVGTSWRERRYDRLHLNTSGRLSHLPGRPYPEGTPEFPSRDQFVEHLEQGAGEDGIDLLLDTEVETIDRNDDGWLVWTSAGKLHTRQLVIATGHQNTPFIPEWQGIPGYEGELIHSSEYRNPDPYRRRSVLVVGSGNSGMEIAHDLAEGGAAQVRLSVRTPPNMIGRGGTPGELFASLLYLLPPRMADAIARFGRRMEIGDLSEFGFPVPEEGLYSRLRRIDAVPAILPEEIVESIKERRFEVVAGVDSLDGPRVVLSDGAHLEPDAVVCATGYRCGLEPLVGKLGVLDERGVPRAVGGRAAAPGLRFVGYVPRPAGIHFCGREAKCAAKEIRRELLATSHADARRPATVSASAGS
jgi:NADPH-dependent 2,4-dienoyl-CoA reductase/sulfur reductase-like enzyme